MKAIEPSLGKAEPFRTVRRPSRKTIISLGESLPELLFTSRKLMYTARHKIKKSENSG